jgi:carbon storage regulator
MLVLSRKRQESIRISDEIVVTVLAVHGNKVQLGIEAPAEVPVHRGEVLKVISGLLSRPALECAVPAA